MMKLSHLIPNLSSTTALHVDGLKNAPRIVLILKKVKQKNVVEYPAKCAVELVEYMLVRAVDGVATIDSKDGLPGNEVTTGNLFIDANDLLWIGTYHGISNFNLRAKATRTFTPLCYIEEILMNGESIDKESGMEFRHFENL